MSNVLKVKVAGQRIRYQVSKVTFNENDLLKANAWRWDCERNALYPNDNKLDIIRDYETFDCADIGVAIRTDGHIFYELGETKGNTIWAEPTDYRHRPDIHHRRGGAAEADNHCSA